MPGNKDEAKWNKAKELVKKEYPNKTEDSDSYWAIVQHIYQNMEKNAMTDKFQTRTAFINSALFRMQNLQNGLDQTFAKLSKLMEKANEIVTHLDALSADQHSSSMNTATKKLKKALDSVAAAKDAVDSVFEEVSEGMQGDDIVLDDESNEDTDVEADTKEDNKKTEKKEEDKEKNSQSQDNDKDEYLIEKDEENDDTDDSIVVDDED